MLTFEDYPLGRVIELGPKTITAEEIIAFAEKFDPQPFHTDPNSKQAVEVGGLIASGWHTCSLFMRMMCDAFLLDTASQGSAGLEEVNWRAPVRPGDTLRGTATVRQRRTSARKPGLGIVLFDYAMFNQNDSCVLTMKGSGMIDVGGASVEASE